MDSLRLKINVPFCGGVPLKKRKFIVSEFRAKNPSPLTFNLFFFFYINVHHVGEYHAL